MANILDTGVCAQGHSIEAESDIYTYTSKSGTSTQSYTFRVCRTCKLERSRTDNARRYATNKKLRSLHSSPPGRLAHLDCGHVPLFDRGDISDPRGIPLPTEIIWCVRCDAAAEVVKVEIGR